MAASEDSFSKIMGYFISEGNVVIAAYKTKNSIRVFFEFPERLRELKFRVDRLISSVSGQSLLLSLREKDPAKGAKKDRDYFVKIARRAQKKLTKTVSTKDAESVVSSLLAGERNIAKNHWDKISHEFNKVNDVELDIDSTCLSFTSSSEL